MKLLMFLARHFRFDPYEKMLPDAADPAVGNAVGEATIVFLHTEERDERSIGKIVTKAAKNIKWLCGKAGYRTVVLHSFNHLGTSKAPPSVALDIISQIGSRLENAGYEVVQTPFGYVCEWDLAVQGPSLGKVFKEF